MKRIRKTLARLSYKLGKLSSIAGFLFSLPLGCFFIASLLTSLFGTIELFAAFIVPGKSILVIAEASNPLMLGLIARYFGPWKALGVYIVGLFYFWICIQMLFIDISCILPEVVIPQANQFIKNHPTYESFLRPLIKEAHEKDDSTRLARKLKKLKKLQQSKDSLVNQNLDEELKKATETFYAEEKELKESINSLTDELGLK